MESVPINFFRRIEQFFVVIGLLLFSGGLIPLFESNLDLGTYSAGDPITQKVYLVLYVIAIGLVIVNAKRVFHALVSNKLLIVLLLFVCLSLLWSASEGNTVKRLFGLVGSTCFGMYIASRFDITRFLKLLAVSFGLGAILSLFAGLFLPELALDNTYHMGSWKGIYVHKNFLGRFMVLSCILQFIFAIRKGRYRLFFWLMFCLSFVLVLLSSSLTALLTFLIIIVTYFLLKIYQRNTWEVVPIVILLSALTISFGYLMMNYSDFIFDSIGKDVTLTGRTVLWSAIIEKISERPFFGYGYGGFWTGWDGESASVWLQAGWMAPHAHNGFLELMLDIGIIGLTLFTALFIQTVVRSLRVLKEKEFNFELWPAIYLFFQLFINFTESNFLRHGNLFWALFITTTLYLSNRQVKEPMKSAVNEVRFLVGGNYIVK
ncbi:hypothetical protein ASG89_30075 [Paenibacillus sp. Soil766]|uniref:O-antigen ligase family protein n=1 Tax=Paenibacillus sp. Soil766 TaxID=1736404 RepID=UPI00070DEB09|nr:O-antigen ligase [Paenibacillus sp. Soil766]KRE97105.1 hypothetical protein ASG89_30075 [Paenibacillus sp. Soil766]